jgi:hypothetical protein
MHILSPTQVLPYPLDAGPATRCATWPGGTAAPGHPALLRPARRQHRLALAGHYRRPVVMGDGEARRHGDAEGRKG